MACKDLLFPITEDESLRILSLNERVVLAAILNEALYSSNFNPTDKMLATFINIPIRTIQRIIKNLETKEFIKRQTLVKNKRTILILKKGKEVMKLLPQK